MEACGVVLAWSEGVLSQTYRGPGGWGGLKNILVESKVPM